MTTVQEIETMLRHRFAGATINVVDDSAKHAGHESAPAGGGSHFTVTVICKTFQGMNRVARHRAIYSVLQPLFDRGLHALAIEAKTPDEAK